MKTRAFLLALPLLALAACADNRASVQVQAVCSATDDCTFAETCDTQALGNPIIDTARTKVLDLPLQVENQLPDNTNRAIGKTNTNDAHIDEAVVEYQGAYTGRAVLEMNAVVFASGSSVIFVQIIPSVVGTALGAPGTPREVLANLKLRGYYDDGTRFETGEFPVAIKVCTTGCAPTCTSGIYCPHAGQYPVACGT